ncbi:MAG TPA: acyclic terpene utilization AtuA family protein, partial [Fodinibius sp.]|nr:acyclic terpene utilization AtuA family protein [Fodinibius sp.]
DKMAAGIIAGHVIECGAQVSGGNFTDWLEVDNLADIGFPIIEAFSDGSFVVTKHAQTGGLINEMTVKEQLVYEIQDPKRYLTPDVTADFTSVKVRQAGENRVHMSGIKGAPPTETYKVSASYIDGYKLTSTLVYVWPDALNKAQKGGEIIRQRTKALELAIDDFRVDYVGVNGCSEQPIVEKALHREYDEVQMRIAVSGKDKEDINRLGKEIVPLILTGPSGVTGYAGGRPSASEIVAYWPALIHKEAVSPRVRIF